ncbi:MAG: DUF1868 domain-containing protein [Candidatus Omnitrophica bacterium]|nr:DUF1868 domain-containing protein [Candidatus Omnitrophota bacterium]
MKKNLKLITFTFILFNFSVISVSFSGTNVREMQFDLLCKPHNKKVHTATISSHISPLGNADLLKKYLAVSDSDHITEEKIILYRLVKSWMDQLPLQQVEKVLIGGENIEPFGYYIRKEGLSFAHGIRGLMRLRAKAVRKRSDSSKYRERGDYFTWFIKMIRDVDVNNLIASSLAKHLEYIRDCEWSVSDKNTLFDYLGHLIEDVSYQKNGSIVGKQYLLERYKRSSIGSTQYFTNVAQQLYIPQGARDKYASNGTVRDFPGYTIVNWFDTKAKYHSKLTIVARELEGHIKAKGLTDLFSFLPPETYHITLYDLVTWPNNDQINEIPKGVQEVYDELKDKLQQVEMEIKGISISAGSSIVAWCYPKDEEGLEVLYLLRERLREKLLPVIGGNTLADAEALVGHVTLAYITNDIPVDKYAALKKILDGYSEYFIADFTIGNADLRWFHNMEKWDDPISTLTFNNAKKTSFDLALLSKLDVLLEKDRFGVFSVDQKGVAKANIGPKEKVLVDPITRTIIYRGAAAVNFLNATNYFANETQIIVFSNSIVEVDVGNEQYNVRKPSSVFINANTAAHARIRQGDAIVITTEKAPEWYDFYGPESKTYRKLFKDLRGYNKTGLVWERKGVLVYEKERRRSLWAPDEPLASPADSVTYGGKNQKPPIACGIFFNADDYSKKKHMPFKEIRPAESLHRHPRGAGSESQTEIYFIAKGTAGLLFIERGIPQLLFLRAGDMAIVAPDTMHEILFVGSGRYEHVAVQVPSTYQYGYKFRENISDVIRTSFGLNVLDNLNRDEVHNVFLFLLNEFRNDHRRLFPLYECIEHAPNVHSPFAATDIQYSAEDLLIAA